MADEKEKTGKKMEEKAEEKKKTEEAKEKPEEKSEDKKEQAKEAKKPKTKAVVNSFNAHLSAKTSSAVCRFIVRKSINEAISDLEEVAKGKKPVPMRGEIPHRKGKIMSGRYPKNTAEYFIKLLKTLRGNANVNNLEEPFIAEAIANIGERPYGRFGSIRRKRAHITIIAKNKNKTKKQENKTENREKKK